MEKAMIGEQIKQARIELNWTQSILALILKVSKNCVSNWERNKQVPNKAMQKKLERVLKIKFQEEETKKQEKNSIGSIIQQARKAKKLTQKELANKLGVSASSISSWENNKSTPNAKMQEKLCQILGLNITNLEDKKVRPNKKQVKKQKEAQNEAKESQNVAKEAKEALNKENESQNIANDVTDALTQNDVTENQEENDNKEYRILPLGESDFEEIIEENMYYIDHTRVIRDIIKSSGKIKLMTRPRRFEKTLTLNMLQCFFEYGGNPNLFQNLEITKYPEICQKYQNQYPVVVLTFKDVEATNFETARAMLCKAIYNEAGRFVFLRKSPQLDEEDIQQYNELRQDREMKNDSINTSLETLIRLLYKHYGKKVVVLIDEYDVPLTKAYQENYYSQMLPLIRSLLSNGLKDNKALKFAVITGCLKISKESIFTGLNKELYNLF